jgi:hypothetical protein
MENDRLIRLRSVAENVREAGKVILLTAGSEVVRPPETASVPESPKSLENAPCRNRTRNRVVHYQLLTRPDSQIDSQKLRSDAMLIEFIRLWRRLDERTQRALLGAACAYELSGGGT